MRIPSQIYPAQSHHAARSEQSSSDAAKDGGKVQPGRSEAGSVTVNVSAQAHALAEESSIDQAKVDRLRGLIERGELQIDPRAIAERIVEEQ